MMLDRSLPFYHIIMRCDRILPMEVTLPAGYTIRPYQAGDEEAWAALHVATGDFTSAQEAKVHFLNRYGAENARVLFALSPEGDVVGTVAAGTDMRQDKPVRTLEWLAVQKEAQQQGIGRALCKTALKLMRREDNAAPVYLHTQPWSWVAVLLAASLGFKLQQTDTFGAYGNEYASAMKVLKDILATAQYDKLVAATAAEIPASDLSGIRFDERGLVPAIAQDAKTGRVLMLAYMNQESIQKTLETGYATYFSRSRQQLWMKGETSGHTQRVLAMRYDCDGDTVLLTVNQIGPACHTGSTTCFFHDVYVSPELPATSAILQRDYDTIADRAAHPVEGSYTNYLLNKGKEKICKKLGEEASETIIAAMKNDPKELTGEAADLLYHLMVLLYQQGVTLTDVWNELDKRK